MDNLKLFAIIFLAVFFGTSFANWQGKTHYKVDFVSATSTESFSEYLNRQGEYGWGLWSYQSYSDGREYIFKK